MVTEGWESELFIVVLNHALLKVKEVGKHSFDISRIVGNVKFIGWVGLFSGKDKTGEIEIEIEFEPKVAIIRVEEVLPIRHNTIEIIKEQPKASI